MEVELRHLRSFIAVAEERNFGRAATRLGIGQPPLSQQIRRLEEKLGTELFDRSTRPVSLTTAGAAFLDDARVSLDQVRHSLERARKSGSNEVGHLRVAAHSWAYNGVVPTVVRAFHARLPEVNLELSSLPPLPQGDALRDEQVDVVFATWRIDTRALKAEALLEELMVALVPQDHPFAERAAISLEQLAGEPFVSLSPRWVQHFSEQTALFRQRGLTRNIVQYAFGPLELLGLVAAGLGVSLHLASFASVKREGVAYVPLKDAPATTVFLLWRRSEEREFVHGFLETAREVTQRSNGDFGSTHPAGA